MIGSKGYQGRVDRKKVDCRPGPEMTPRQRMMVAMRNGIPDRVPVAPDISCMVPVRHSGKGYFSVFINEDPPLWRAYLDAVKYFGIDGWFIYGNIAFQTKDVETSERWILDTPDRKIREITYHTPKGEISQQILISADKPPITFKKLIKDVDRDWPRFKYLMGEIVDVDHSWVKIQKEELGEAGAYGIGIATPGFQMWNDYFEGGLITLSYLEMDRPEILEELREVHHARLMQELNHMLKANPDFILTGGSGSITMSSPRLWLKYSFPTLQEQCEVCGEGGVATMVHSCGREKFMVDTCAQKTALNCINPLEIPPMGDITLAEAKQLVEGTHLSLMGNLHTTSVMLRGTAEQVKEAARQAIEDAGAGGGFILSTGDQCGWATPDENIFTLVEVAETYRRYDKRSR